MKKLYHKLLCSTERLPAKLEITKTKLAEYYSIFRKAPLYKHIHWTKQQQKEFDCFWKTNYGKRISNRWHKLYEAANGVHRVDYFPEYLYSTKLEPMLNDYSYVKVFANKNLLDLFFDGRLNNVRTPKFFLFNDHGSFYDANRHLICREKVLEILSNIGEAVIKPTVDTSSGKNVIIVHMDAGKDTRSGQSAEEILASYGSNFSAQERLQPCNHLKILYPHAINTIRVITYLCGDKIGVAPISLRIGGGGSEVDNIHAGGMSIAVDDKGFLAKRAYRLGYGDSLENHTAHPDTKVVFEGYRLPFIPAIIEAAKQLHTKTANIGMISWDFTVDSEDRIVVVEANYQGQSAWFPQMLSGRSLFGENTASILKSLKRKQM